MQKKIESRTKNSIKNLQFALIGQVINLLLQFFLRTAFIHTLGKEYLGINGLFSNILSFLSLAELGIGEAITISLYKPIAENDENKIKILMRIFKKAYCIIGIVITVAGLGLTPFLSVFIKEMPDIEHIYIIYMLNVLLSSISYFYSYKSIFIIANQKNYIVTNNRYVVTTISTIFRCVILFVWGNYILYLMASIFFVLAENISVSILADKYYPILKEKSNDSLDKETQNTIIDNISALVFHRIGGIVVFSTDNIMLSKFSGIIITGLYSNYSMILNAVNSILSQFFNSMIASVGNLHILADEEKQIEIYNVIYFINFWLYAFAATACLLLIQPFITLWAGEEYLMTNLVLFAIIVNFYMTGMRKTNSMFCSAYGLVRYYKIAPLFEITINIISSIVLAKIIGEAGIFIGTIISTVCVCLWVEPYILFKYGIKYSLRKYFLRYFLYLLITTFIILVSYLIINVITVTGITAFILKMLTVVIIPNIILFIIFRNSTEFKTLYNIILRKF